MTMGTTFSFVASSMWNERTEPPRSTRGENGVLVLHPTWVGLDAFLAANESLINLDSPPNKSLGANVGAFGEARAVRRRGR